jgi:predicted transcriptional regulator
LDPHHNNMTNIKTTNHSMTLRLDPTLAETLESTAFDLRMSQAAFIRRAIRRSLEHSQAHELPLVRQRDIQAALMR